MEPRMLDLFRHLRTHAPSDAIDLAHLGEAIPYPPPTARLLPGDPCDAMLPPGKETARVPAR